MTDTLPAIPTVGSVLNMIPARRRAKVYLRHKASGERWTVPLIGWATVVNSHRDEGWSDDDPGVYETSLEAVVMVEGWCPMTLRDHLRYDLEGCEIVKVRP